MDNTKRDFLDKCLPLLSKENDQDKDTLFKIIANIIFLVLLSENFIEDNLFLNRMKEKSNKLRIEVLIEHILSASRSKEPSQVIIHELLEELSRIDDLGNAEIDVETFFSILDLVPLDLNSGSQVLSLVVEHYSGSIIARKKRGSYYTLQEDAELISFISGFRFLQHVTKGDSNEDLFNMLTSKSTKQEQVTLFADLPSEISILDPSCGTGSFLVEIIHFLARLGSRLANKKLKVSVYGYDLNSEALIGAKFRILLLKLSLIKKYGFMPIEIEFRFSTNDFLLNDINNKFDIIIGNPPYIRHEDIGMYQDPGYKESLQEKYLSLLEPNVKLDRKSDYLIYFCIKCLDQLKSSGVLVFLTSNAWLEVKYGKTLQNQLISLLSRQKLTNCEIIHQSRSRLWEHLGINSVIFLAVKSEKKSVIRAKIFFTETFIDLREIPPSLLKQGLIFGKEFSSKEYRTEFISIADLKSTHKWAGTFLRATRNERQVLHKLKIRGKPLSDLADVQFGLKTGANDFFHLSVIFQDEKSNLVKITNALGYHGEIENRFLLPLIKSPLECEGFEIPSSFIPKVWLFNCQEPLGNIKSENATKYIQWGANSQVSVKQGKKMGTSINGFHQLKSLSHRDPWFSLPKCKSPHLLWTKSIHDKPGCLLNRSNLIPDQRFYGISVHDSKYIPLIFAYLNSSLIWAQMELSGNTNMGFGVLDTNVYWLKSVRIPTNLTEDQEVSLFKFCTELRKETSRKPITSESPLRRQIDSFFCNLLEISEKEYILLNQFIKRSVINRLKENTKGN